MKKVLFLLIVLVTVMGVFSADGRVIPELVKPTALQIEGTTLYVVEDTTVHIYDVNTLNKIGQFGKAGQGPQEFATVPGQLPLLLAVQNNNLFVASIGKISKWSLKGEYVSELTYNPQNALFPQLLKNGNFLGMSVLQGDDKKLYRAVFLCDEKVNRIKELYRAEHTFQGPGKGLIAVWKVFQHLGYEDHIYLPGKEENQIDVFTLDMKPKYTITVPKDNRSIEQAFKDRFMDEINSNPALKGQLEILKPIIFPDKYPSISFFGAEGQKLFVFTWNFGKDSLEYYSFDTNSGKALGKSQATIQFQGSLSPYPVTFKNGQVYQLVENEDEEWELISSPLK